MIEYRTQYIYRRTRSEAERDTQIALCTCPWCHTVWQHVENPGRAHFDLLRTREEWGKPRDVWDCPACGKQSKANCLREKREKFTRVDLLQR